MISRDLLQKTLDDWARWYRQVLANSLKRETPLLLPKNNALGIVGVRRAGKSYAAVRTLQSYSNVLCINFEDPAFTMDSSVDNLDELVSVYVEEKRTEPSAVLFDEIQNINGWEKWVRKAVELRRFPIVLTGSSSKMLSSELSTALAGRVIEKQVWPLSFSEFLQFTSKNPATRDQWVGELKYFLRWGGFPEVALLNSEEEKIQQLRQYLSDIVLKDIMQRHEIRSKKTLDVILNYYFTNCSSLHTYNSIKKAFGIGIDTVADYTEFCNEAFLLFEMNCFHHNLKVQARSPKKVYCIDTGLRNIHSATRDHDFGRLAENAVYIHLCRRGINATYFSENGEVDFVIVKGTKPIEAIQVTFSDLQDSSLYDREVGSLLKCLQKLGLHEGVILTLTRKETKKLDGIRVVFQPLYEWLKQGGP